MTPQQETTGTWSMPTPTAVAPPLDLARYRRRRRRRLIWRRLIQGAGAAVTAYAFLGQASLRWPSVSRAGARGAPPDTRRRTPFKGG